jgi:hypothetical protein
MFLGAFVNDVAQCSMKFIYFNEFEKNALFLGQFFSFLDTLILTLRKIYVVHVPKFCSATNCS